MQKVIKITNPDFFTFLKSSKYLEILFILLTCGLKKPYINQISKKINSTYSHIVKIINNLEEFNFVKKIDTNSRIKYVELTPKGRSFAYLILGLKQEYEK